MKTNMMLKATTVFFVIMMTAACNKPASSFSLLAADQQFTQGAATIAVKVDILWVVDNSGSMAPLQQSLASNFNSFINGFVGKGYDFRMGVTTTDAYLSESNFLNNNTYSKFRDGNGTTHSGVYIIQPNTPNLTNTFITNINQGDKGDGDERAFSSMRDSLKDTFNVGFHRPGAFLAVIILSDEDDFSDPTRPEGSWMMPGGVADHSYTNPTLDTVGSYLSFLDSFTGSTDPTNRKYSVSAITVLDQACLNQHVAQSSVTIIGQRYIDMANQTKGVVGSICSSFSNSLLAITGKILELSSQFQLNRKPIVSTIAVSINGSNVPNSAVDGWTYDASSNSITFHGTAIPAQGATINVYFEPATVQT